MTIHVSPTRLSVRQVLSVRLHDAITHISDRVVLAAFFVLLFSFHFAVDLLNGFSYAFTLGHELATSRTASGAELFGFAAIAVVLKDIKADRVLGWWDVVAIIGVTIACIYPSHAFCAIGLTCLGLLFVARSDERIASLGQLCVGLAWVVFWGPLALSLIAQWLLPIEAKFAYFPLSFFGPFLLDGTIISNGGAHAINILEPCSAFHNTVATGFIWLSLIKIQKLEFQLKHFGILAIGLAAVVLFNTARIDAMAVSEHQFLFWHFGFGGVIVKVTMLSAVLSIFYFGLRPTPMRTA